MLRHLLALLLANQGGEWWSETQNTQPSSEKAKENLLRGEKDRQVER